MDDRENYGEERFILVGTAEGTVLTIVYTEKPAATGSSQQDALQSRSKMTTSPKISDRPIRPMGKRQIEAAAKNDLDNRPLTIADLARMKRTPQRSSDVLSD